MTGRPDGCGARPGLGGEPVPGPVGHDPYIDPVEHRDDEHAGDLPTVWQDRRARRDGRGGTVSVQATQVLWDMLDGPMPRGVLGLSDPHVQHVDGRWVMLVGGFSTSFRNRLYRATLAPGADLAAHGWRFDRDARGRLRPLAPDGRRGDWDAGGMHTPCHVPPHRGHPARVYYAGRRTARRYGDGSAYAIGLLERAPDGSWSRRARPVLEGDHDRPSVLEPTVVPVDDGYRMWFLSTPHEVGPGEQPDFELRVSDSADGVTWSPPQVFATSQEGWFDCALDGTAHGWTMLLARGTNLHGTRPYPPQGLWRMRAATPSGRREDWSPAERVLDTGAPATPAWMGRGVCGPSVATDADGTRLVFLTGTHRAPSWPRLAARRLASARRPPVPAPYFLATGAVVLDGPAT